MPNLSLVSEEVATEIAKNCRQVVQVVLLGDIVLYVMQRLKSHTFTPLEISLLLQTKVTKNCYYQMCFLGSDATEMSRRPGLRPGPRWESLQCTLDT